MTDFLLTYFFLSIGSIFAMYAYWPNLRVSHIRSPFIRIPILLLVWPSAVVLTYALLILEVANGAALPSELWRYPVSIFEDTIEAFRGPKND